MTGIARKSDGRRIFTDAFKGEQIAHVWNGEMTLAELSRKLGIARSLLQRWKRHMPRDSQEVALTGPVQASGWPTVEFIRDLQLLIGKQAVELELLRAQLDALKKGRRAPRASKR
jgi:transposase-like protein